MLNGILRGLDPGQASRRPALFMLEIAAALLTVLALHDWISDGRGVWREFYVAAGLWGVLLAVLCGLANPATRYLRVSSGESSPG